jgi:hypothetical protein
VRIPIDSIDRFDRFRCLLKIFTKYFNQSAREIPIIIIILLLLLYNNTWFTRSLSRSQSEESQVRTVTSYRRKARLNSSDFRRDFRRRSRLSIAYTATK